MKKTFLLLLLSTLGVEAAFITPGTGGSGGVSSALGITNGHSVTWASSNTVTIVGPKSSGIDAVPFKLGGANVAGPGLNNPFNEVNLSGGTLGIGFWDNNLNRLYNIGLSDNFLRNDYSKVLPSNEAMLGAQAGSMLDNNGGSVSAAWDMPPHGQDIWQNQPLPVIGVRIGNSSAPSNPDATTGLECSTTNVTLVLSNLSTFGILGITNNGIRPVLYFDAGYLAHHRGADGNLTNRADIIPETGNSGITNLFNKIHTSNTEVWVTGYFDPAPLTNGSTEADMNPVGLGYFQYPNGSANPNGSGYIHPVTTPAQVQTDVNLYYSWGADGWVVQDQLLGGYVGYELQRARKFGNAIMYPQSATFRTYQSVIVNSYFNHPMSLSLFHNIPQFPSLAYECNSLVVDQFSLGWAFNDGVNPIGTFGVNFSIANAKTFYRFVHNAPAKSIHPTWLFGNGAPANNLTQFKSYFAGAALFKANIFVQQDISDYTLDWFDFAACVTNKGFQAVFADTAQNPVNAIVNGSIYARTLYDGSIAVFSANETGSGVGIVLTTALLGLPAGTLMNITNVWSGANFATAAANYTDTVGANDHTFMRITPLIPNTIIQGGNVVTVTTTYTVLVTDSLIRADTTSAGFTVTLPATPNYDQVVNVKKISSDGNTLTINGNGHNIDGSSTKTTSVQYTSFNLQYDSATSTWNIL